MGDHAQLTVRDIRGPYTQLLINLQGENGSEWLEALNTFLRKENPWKLFGAGSLVPVGPLTERFEPERFFNNRNKRLHLFQSIDQLVRYVGPTDTAGVSILGYADLTRDASEREIRAELPKNH